MAELTTVEEEGRRCAVRGGQRAENPFLEGGDDAKYLAWNRGFRSARVPDPQCPLCRGTGRAVLRADSSAAGGAYDGSTIEDLCNSSARRSTG